MFYQLFSALCKDRLFWLALGFGPLVWLGNRYFGLSHPAAITPSFILWFGVLLPVIEELAFRGAMQGWLLARAVGRRRLLGLSLANWLSSGLFVLFHLVGQSPAWALAVLFPSLVFGVFRERHNSVLPGIILHVIYNIGFFVLR
ncbi:MAG: JDVT-CTERM system glutamic-type intramembrane protease MrtJ [Granulosicoccaceae bacterium]